MSCSQEAFENLIKMAKHYERAEDFIDSVDWEPDWMLELMEDPESELLSDNDRIAINKVLIDAYQKAHGVVFGYYRRWNLLNH